MLKYLEAIAELAEAQRRTEHEVRILVSELKDTKKWSEVFQTLWVIRWKTLHIRPCPDRS